MLLARTLQCPLYCAVCEWNACYKSLGKEFYVMQTICTCLLKALFQQQPDLEIRSRLKFDFYVGVIGDTDHPLLFLMLLNLALVFF